MNKPVLRPRCMTSFECSESFVRRSSTCLPFGFRLQYLCVDASRQSTVGFLCGVGLSRRSCGERRPPEGVPTLRSLLFCSSPEDTRL
jgi:hypothetical protein